MTAAVTKKVRLKPQEARRLRSIAKDLEMTESEVLRQGISFMERVRDRRKNVDKLIALIGDAPEPPKVRFRTKW